MDNKARLTAISPLDGRYRSKLVELQFTASEYGLIYYRVYVEIYWLLTLIKLDHFIEIKFKDDQVQFLENIITQFNETEAEKIINFEATTNHDVKAVEYYLQEKLKNHSELSLLIPFIHFGCTSEDINNLAYGLMLLKIKTEILSPVMINIIQGLNDLAHSHADLAMLSRTHGQPASPTTLGKEIANFSVRLQRQLQNFQQMPILGKFNGAVGNFNAHRIAAPNINWTVVSKEFITRLGLTPNSYTTQIEPHDNLAEHLHTLIRFNTILIDMNRDIWGYISLNYFSQKKIENEIGSSTMPHKINPIDFENSEGNLGIANALASHLAEKLPISRWQRDLTDSTVLRNLGSVVGYSLLAYKSLLKGLQKLSVNQTKIQQDLSQHWEILAEAIQTILRRHGVIDAYEQLKSLTRGKKIDQKIIAEFIENLPLPPEIKNQFRILTPEQYLVYASELTHAALEDNCNAKL